MSERFWKITTFVLGGVLLVGLGIYFSQFLGTNSAPSGNRAPKTEAVSDSTIPFKVALLYKNGAQPVARTKFYLLSTDIRPLHEDKDGKIIFTQPSLAKQLATQGYGDGRIGIKEENIKEYIIASSTTDFDGNGRFEGIKPGVYWLAGFATTRSENGYVVWSVRVNFPNDARNLMLDQNNAFEAEEW